MRRALILIAMSAGVVACATRPRSRAAMAIAPSVAKPIVVTLAAAWTSVTGLHKFGAAGVIDGTDGCNGGASLPAVAVPADPGYTQTGGSPLNVLHGAPPLIDTTLGHSARDVARGVQIDWRRLIDPRELAPDFVFPRDSAAMPGSAYFETHAGAYPTILIDNDTLAAHAYVLTGSGRGLLVTKGDLVFRGVTSWSGLILVGGTLTFQGAASVDGAVVTGLNVTLGYSVPVNVLRLRPPMRIIYNSCSVRAALVALHILS